MTQNVARNSELIMKSVTHLLINENQEVAHSFATKRIKSKEPKHKKSTKEPKNRKKKKTEESEESSKEKYGKKRSMSFRF